MRPDLPQPPGDGSTVLLVGQGPVADATERALGGRGVAVVRIEQPTDRDVREGIGSSVDRVLVISRSDHVALRWALVVAHHRPEMPTLVTIFDRHVAAELAATEANVSVLSISDLVVPCFAGPCLDPTLLSLVPSAQTADTGPSGIGPSGIGLRDGRPVVRPQSWSVPGAVARLAATLRALARPFDVSARTLVYGLAGFFAVLLLDTAVTTLVEHAPLAEAFYTSAKVLVTVGPSEATDRAGPAVKVYSAVAMLVALGFAAVLTAGLVDRLVDPRLTGILGAAAVPRRDHVVVVGLGQIGHRLCELLRELGVPVIAVERDPGARQIAQAKELKLPVVIGDGSDRRTLDRLSVRRARALVAVTSDDAENLAVAVAARGLRADLTIALRAGDGDATSEIQSLFHIGVVRDIYGIAGAAVAAIALGHPVRQAFPYGDTTYLLDADAGILPVAGPPDDPADRSGPVPSR